MGATSELRGASFEPQGEALEPPWSSLEHHAYFIRTERGRFESHGEMLEPLWSSSEHRTSFFGGPWVSLATSIFCDLLWCQWAEFGARLA